MKVKEIIRTSASIQKRLKESVTSLDEIIANADCLPYDFIGVGDASGRRVKCVYIDDKLEEFISVSDLLMIPKGSLNQSHYLYNIHKTYYENIVVNDDISQALERLQNGKDSK